MGSATTVGLLYMLFAVVPAAMTLVVWRHRDERAGTPLFVAGLGATGTSLCWGLWLLPMTPSTGAGASAVLVAYGIALDTATIGAFYVGVEYTAGEWLERAPFVLGLGTVALLFTVLTSVPIPLYRAAGPPAWVRGFEDAFHVGLSVALLGMLAGRTLTTRGVYRKQSATLLAGFGVSTGAGVLAVLLGREMLNPTPAGVTIGAGAVAWALFRYEFLQTSPVARQRLFERLTEPVFALDGRGRLLDLNAAAERTASTAGPSGTAGPTSSRGTRTSPTGTPTPSPTVTWVSSGRANRSTSRRPTRSSAHCWTGEPRACRPTPSASSPSAGCATST